MSGFGWYCRACGALHSRLPEGFVTCGRCGGLGLRGYERLPRRVRCQEDGCDFVGWDDGGVNPDLPRHMRRDHDKEPIGGDAA